MQFRLHKTTWHIYHDNRWFRSWDGLYSHLYDKHHQDLREANAEYVEVRQAFEAMRSRGAGERGSRGGGERMNAATSVFVCWSVAQRMHTADRGAICHIQDGNGRTLCGISTAGRWEFEIHDNAEFVSCQRCKKKLRSA